MKQNLYKHVLLILSMVIIGLHIGSPMFAQEVNVGAGSYTTSFPGTDAAGRNGFPTGTPALSGVAATKPVPTNDWWSDLMKQDHGGKAFNYPLSFVSQTTGLVINYTVPRAGPIEYREPISDVRSIVVGTDGLNATQSTPSDHSDWSVTMDWANEFNATLNIGSPFVYFEKNTNSAAKVSVNFNAEGVSVDGNKLIITGNMNNSNYVVFAPTGATWTGSGGIYTSTLNGNNYWSMALIPIGADVETAINALEPYAYVFPGNTAVDWNYNESTGSLRTTFTVTPDIKEGSNSQVLQGLLPHQWSRLASGAATVLAYSSVRGEIKTMGANTFIVENTFSGILPTLPDLGKYSDGFDPGALAGKIAQLKNDGLAEWTDSYNEGQVMNRLIQAARISDQMGDLETRDVLVSTVQTRLEDWFTAEGGEVAFLFYYNDDWDALLGYPAGHRQDVNLNDHHFHWGYFIHAAAAIEQFNPGWADQWGGMVDMLIRDAANPSRDDSMFPFLRNFSPYAGHSWANGFASEPFGNDQESTSESMQFNSALIHWGTLTNNDEIRDLGIYLYTTEESTVQEYWFDTEERNFQPEYQYNMVARVWGGGYDNGTWWTTDIAASYGIQMYPIHGGSLYLSHHQEYLQRVWTEITQNTDVLSNIPNDNLWYDTYWKFLSFLDPQEAVNLYNAYPERDLKFGVSDAQTYHWLHGMNAMGKVKNEVTANYPIASAFEQNGAMTYVAHNYGNSPITVNYSDGFNLSVPANSMATNRDINIDVTFAIDQSEISVGGNVNMTAAVTGSGVSKVEFYVGDQLVGTDTSAPYTANSGSLSAGLLNLYAKAYVGNDLNVSNILTLQVGAQLPYNGQAIVIPGVIQAGHYDTFEGGLGQGVAYSDNDANNEGNFRGDEGVDASATMNQGATVGWINAGEWLEYTINVDQGGTYKATMKYASGNAGGGGPFWLERDGTKISGDVNVVFTGTDWNVWNNVEVQNIQLAEGEQVIRVQVGNGGFNLGSMNFEFVSAGTPVLTTINVTPENSTIDMNANQQFAAAGIDQFGGAFSFMPTWSVNGGSIDENGLFTGAAAGTFTVAATGGSITGDTEITVLGEPEEPVLTSIVVSPASYTLIVGDTLQYSAIGLDQFGSNYSITPSWSIDGAIIDGNGLFVGSTIGSYMVMAVVDSITGMVQVDVIEEGEEPVLTSIILTPSSTVLSLGEPMTFIATGVDQYGEAMSVNPIWESTGGTINAVTGEFSSAEIGDFTVTATVDEISEMANVYVIDSSGEGLPFVINNTSGYPDSEIYVAIVGEDLTGPPGVHVWVDAKTGVQYSMDPSYNTVQGPIYNGNAGPGGSGLYANCFTKLSDIPNSTVDLAQIQGCRIFMSVGEPLYFWFFGGTGAPSGYTAPSKTEPSDPNKGIRFEIIELTFNEYGFFGNPTRVDSYQMPLGFELYGADNYYMKVGELVDHETIVSSFVANVPVEFQGCLDPETGEITAPSKTPEFADGSIGSMPEVGVYVDYFKPYIDQIWAKYTNEDLYFDSGDAGIWRGRVQGETLVLTSESPAFIGRQGIIVRRPTTQEAFEGKGVLDNVVQDATTDLLVQAQITAAINRHVIDVTTPNVGLQMWDDDAEYYLESPCNHYAKFFHMTGISASQRSYGFAYDDVWDYSSSVHSPNPTQGIITLGGFAGENQDPVLTSIQVSPASTSIALGDTQQFSAVGRDQFGEPMAIDVIWSVDNNASISMSGLFDGIVEGDFTIIASNGGVSGSVTISVDSGSQTLTSIMVSPDGISIDLNNSQMFSAQGFDQDGNPMSTNVSWTATEGSISSNGLYTGTIVGSQTITASQGAIIGQASVDVLDTNNNTCIGGPDTGDYNYSVFSEGGSPTITFVPGRDGVGDNIVLLYYATSLNGPWPGHVVSPNVAHEITAEEGQTVYFYYTYSVPEGGERNTIDDKHEVVIGDCSTSEEPILTEIIISPETWTMDEGEQLQYVATCLDQFGDSFALDLSWTSTGGSIDLDGLYTGTEVGTFDVTASQDGVSTTASIAVSEIILIPVLTSIVISPDDLSIALNGTQQYAAQGFDQNGNPMSTNVSWTVSGGNVDGNGLYTASSEGTYSITASEGSIEGTATVVVTNTRINTCNGEPSNGDYSYSVSSESLNPTITFEPGRVGVGDNILILYYTNSLNGPWAGYNVSPEQAFAINASVGETVYFYYTYSLPEGGENNTANDKHEVVIGDCGEVEIPVLTSIDVSPSNAIIELGQSQQFVGAGFDQNGSPMAVNITWSSSNGAIDSNGLYSGTEIGSHHITATSDGVSGSVLITVSSEPISCVITGAIGDFDVEISSDDNDPTITFLPARLGVGNNIVILYYANSANGPWPGHIVTPGEAFQVNANEGETVHFYYTYSLPEGGENNTFGNKGSFEVGACSSSSRIGESSAATVLQEAILINMYPNPSENVLNVESSGMEISSYTIFDLTGHLVERNEGLNRLSTLKINVEDLQSGQYLLQINNANQSEIRRFIKR
ncbi:MAG: beta-1,3-glucanase family protein [Reichenbachiella sp.]